MFDTADKESWWRQERKEFSVQYSTSRDLLIELKLTLKENEHSKEMNHRGTELEVSLQSIRLKGHESRRGVSGADTFLQTETHDAVSSSIR